MFREIRRKERITENTRKEENYKNIKPETNMTVEEAVDFWTEVFNKVESD